MKQVVAHLYIDRSARIRGFNAPSGSKGGNVRITTASFFLDGQNVALMSVLFHRSKVRVRSSLILQFPNLKSEVVHKTLECPTSKPNSQYGSTLQYET